MVRSNETVNLLLLHLHVLLLLLNSHYEAAIGGKLVLRLRARQILLVNNLVRARRLRVTRLVPLILECLSRSTIPVSRGRGTVVVGDTGGSLWLVSHSRTGAKFVNTRLVRGI